MIINSYNKDFKKYKKIIKKEIEYLSPLYSDVSSEYYYHATIRDGISFKDISFICLKNKQPVYLFQGQLLIQNNKISLINYQIPCISIENHNIIDKKVEKEINLQFDQILKNVTFEIHYRDNLINNNISIFSRYLTSKGYTLNYAAYKTINLLHSEDSLKKNVRKSYKSLINWGNKHIDKIIINKKNITEEHIKHFRSLHKEVSGKFTRSYDSWLRQLKLVQSDEGFIIFGFKEKELISAGFFMHNEKNCYYASSASKRDLFDKPIFHSIMMEAILYSKKIGCEWFEVGDHSFIPYTKGQQKSKILDIEKFKSGFGGLSKLYLYYQDKLIR